MTREDAYDKLYDEATVRLQSFSQNDWQRVLATYAGMSDDERQQFERETDVWVDGYTRGIASLR